MQGRRRSLLEICGERVWPAWYQGQHRGTWWNRDRFQQCGYPEQSAGAAVDRRTDRRLWDGWVKRTILAVSWPSYAAMMPDGSRANVLRRRADSTCKERLLAQAGFLLISRPAPTDLLMLEPRLTATAHRNHPARSYSLTRL